MYSACIISMCELHKCKCYACENMATFLESMQIINAQLTIYCSIWQRTVRKKSYCALLWCVCVWSQTTTSKDLGSQQQTQNLCHTNPAEHRYIIIKRDSTEMETIERI